MDNSDDEDPPNTSGSTGSSTEVQRISGQDQIASGILTGTTHVTYSDDTRSVSNSSAGLTSEKTDETSSDGSSKLNLGHTRPTYSLLSQDHETTTIHTLPNELLDYILCFLDIKQRIRSEQVCKRWRWLGKCRPWGGPRSLLFDPSRWEKTNMGRKFDLTDSVFADILTRCGSSVKHLTLSNRVGPECGIDYLYEVSLTEMAVKMVGKYCPNLSEIEIGGIPLTARSLKRLALGCRNLRVVRLSMFYSKRVSVNGLAGFYERCTNLESLTLELPNEIDGFENISHKLKVLRLERCAGKGIKPIDLQSLMVRCNCIQELGLNDYNENSVNPKLLLKVLDHYKNTLRVLESTICHPKRVIFDWCTALQILRKLEKLTLCTLGIRHECSRHFTGECFNETSKSLRILDIKGSLYEDVDEVILIKLLNRCEGLRELHISICSNVSPEFLRCCRRFVDTLNVLEAVSVSSCIWEEWCETVAMLSNLEEVQLDFCSQVNDELLKTLAKGCTNLKSLRIRSTDVTDSGLFHLAALPFLAVLDVSNSNNISGRGIEVLALQGHLEELYVATCSKRSILNVSDEECSTLAAFCENFRFLDVSNVNGTKNISNNLVKAFGDALQKGILKQRVTLVVGGTAVTPDVPVYERLEVMFELSVLLTRSFTRAKRRFS